MALMIPLIFDGEIKKMRVIRRNLRDVMDPFDIPNHLFIRTYRLPKPLAVKFIEEVRPIVRRIGRIPLHLQILAVLNFYATGSYQMSVGSNAFHNISQSMISRYVNFYSNVITQRLASKYIHFPETMNGINATKVKFETLFDFPGILGVIDGTHIAVTALPLDIECAFVNRKGFHSINAQVVCDSNMLITNINARFPGSTHDAFIYGGSMIKTRLEEIHQRDPNTFNFLLGDSAYPLSPWLMKIFDGNNLNSVQENFNTKLCGVRQLIERCIGLLKVRFRCILGERKLRYKPTKVGKIIYACATLHNFLIVNQFDIGHDMDMDLLRNVMNNHNVAQPFNLRGNFHSGQTRRNELVTHLFNTLP